MYSEFIHASNVQTCSARTEGPPWAQPWIFYHLLFVFGSVETTQKDAWCVQMLFNAGTEPYAYTEFKCASNMQICIVCRDDPAFISVQFVCLFVHSYLLFLFFGRHRQRVRGRFCPQGENSRLFFFKFQLQSFENSTLLLGFWLWSVCVALFLFISVLRCFVDPTLGNIKVRGHSLNQGTWGCRILTLHLNYVADYTGPLLFLFERTHNYSVDNQGLLP